MTVQSTRDQSDFELIALADETDRLANVAPDPRTASRLREIAIEVRRLAVAPAR